jgi:hypothetical protein
MSEFARRVVCETVLLFSEVASGSVHVQKEKPVTISFRTLAVVLTAVLAAACSSDRGDADSRVAELEKQLAETQKKLADGATTATDTTLPPPAAQSAAAATPAPAPAPPANASAAQGSKPPTPAGNKPSASAAATAQAQKEAEELQAKREEAQRQLDAQRELNARQAETNAKLQQDLERLKPREYTLPAGTTFSVRLPREVSTKGSATGATFDGLLEYDLKSGETVLAKAGTRVNGVVVESDPGGRVKGVASITIGVRSIVGVKGASIAVTTDSQTADAQSTKKKDAVRTGVATGVGALIGGIAGGGKGAAIGAGVGAGAGVGTNMATKGDPAVFPAESLLEFKTQAPVTVTIQP